MHLQSKNTLELKCQGWSEGSGFQKKTTEPKGGVNVESSLQSSILWRCHASALKVMCSIFLSLKISKMMVGEIV